MRRLIGLLLIVTGLVSCLAISVRSDIDFGKVNTATSIWGQITGTLSNQADLQSALDTASVTAVWGSLTGTLTDQSDLVSALAASADELNATDYGVVGDGSTDDTAALQDALDAVVAVSGNLYIPAGNYKITDTLTIAKAGNFRVRGASRDNNGTRIKWFGASGGTMLLLDGVRETEWWDLGFDAEAGGNDAGVLIDIDEIPPGTARSRKNSFRRVFLRGGSITTVRIANTSTVNNEANLFQDVLLYSSSDGNGYEVHNINSKNNMIEGGQISGPTIGLYVVAGSMHLHGVELSSLDTWVKTSTQGEPIMISNCDGDSSDTFLDMQPGQPSPVIAIGNRFISYADKTIFKFGSSANGPLVLIANDFAAGGYKETAISTIAGNGPRVVAIGNVFPNNALFPYKFTDAPHLQSFFSHGNWYYTTGNQYLPYDDVIVTYYPGVSTSPAWTGGKFGSQPTAVQAFNNANLHVEVLSTLIPITSTGSWTLTTTPTLRTSPGVAGVFNGQECRIINVGSSNSITLQDNDTLAGSLLELTASTITIGPRQSVTFLYSSTLGSWVQTSDVIAVN